MTNQDILDAIGHVDDTLVEECADLVMQTKKTAGKARYFPVFTGLAACACIAVLAAPRLIPKTRDLVLASSLNLKPSAAGQTIADMESAAPAAAEASASIPSLFADSTNYQSADIYEVGAGMGCGILMMPSAEYLENGNPWTADWGVTELPVYTNAAFASLDAPFSDELQTRMQALAFDAAAQLGLGSLPVQDNTPSEEEKAAILDKLGETGLSAEEYLLNTQATRYYVETEEMTLCAEPTLSVYIDFSEGQPIPLTGSTLEEKMEAFARDYGDLLGLENPVAANWTDFSYDGTEFRHPFFYEAGSTAAEAAANYSLRYTQLYLDSSSTYCLGLRRYGAWVGDVADTVTLISPQEAEAALWQGLYCTPGGELPADAVVERCELVYRTGHFVSRLAPWYCFWVRSDEETAGVYPGYTPYYVPAGE